MAGAGQRELAWRLEAGSGRAEVGVGVLGRVGLLGSACRQQRDLVHDVLHLMREWLRLQRRGRRRSVPQMHVSLRVTPELHYCAEPLPGTRATLERGLDDADEATRRLATRVAGAGLVRLQGCGRWKCNFAVLANVAKIEIKLSRARGGLHGRWRQAQG